LDGEMSRKEIKQAFICGQGNVEMMHMSFALHSHDVNKEEEMITWAELEAHEVFKIIKLNQ